MDFRYQANTGPEAKCFCSNDPFAFELWASHAITVGVWGPAGGHLGAGHQRDRDGGGGPAAACGASHARHLPDQPRGAAPPGRPARLVPRPARLRRPLPAEGAPDPPLLSNLHEVAEPIVCMPWRIFIRRSFLPRWACLRGRIQPLSSLNHGSRVTVGSREHGANS